MRLNTFAAGTMMGLLSTSMVATALAGPAVVELYTSEGCSSCPPAEKLIEELARRSDVLPLAFHVDYWDSLGWRDRFSLHESTQRQEQAARRLQFSTVGTPEIIVNGHTVIWGAGRAAVERAIASPRGEYEIQVELVGHALTVRPQQVDSLKVFDAYVIGYLRQAVTAIRAGENAGRTVTEINVVRSIQKIGRPDSSGEWHFSLGESPGDAQCLAVLLQEPNGMIAAARTIGRSGNQPCTQVAMR